MKRGALIFMLAVFAPSLVLAWLSIRTLRDQQFLLERQQSLLYQNVADSLAQNAQSFLDAQQTSFSQIMGDALRVHKPDDFVKFFDEYLRTNWPLAEIGFVVSPGGEVVVPCGELRVSSSKINA